MADETATACSLATQAINASKSTTQLLDCKQEGGDIDPHTLYKTIVLASGWMLGMGLVRVYSSNLATSLSLA